MSISILILTLNEEVNLPACLESVKWSDDIVVLDSGSSDHTTEIAAAAGARVLHRNFDNWADHQNWALREIHFKNPWVYYSDADEVVPVDLCDEMMLAASNKNVDEVAYRVRYKNMFMGRWLKHSSLYPTWILRLFKPQKVRWERLVNPVAVVDGPVGRLGAHFIHYSFNKGFDAWFDKHNKYSRHEAIEAIKHIRKEKSDFAGLLAIYDPIRQRRALKELSFRVPLRPTLRFLYMYIFRMGFLDGGPGFTYCMLLSFYEYMISLKMKEICRTEKGLPL